MALLLPLSSCGRRSRCNDSDTAYPLSGPWPGTRGWLGHHLDDGIVSTIRSTVENKTLLDIGSGTGMYGAHFHELRERGKVAPFWTGFDGSPGVENYTRTMGPPGSLTRHANLCDESVVLPRKDWVMSLEVGEHLPQSCMSNYLRLLDEGNRKGMFLSWAVPGQAGFCHISTKANDVVTAAFAVLGYEPLRHAWVSGRRVARMDWFRKTFMAFKRVRSSQRCGFTVSLIERAARCLANATHVDPVACSTACPWDKEPPPSYTTFQKLFSGKRNGRRLGEIR